MASDKSQQRRRVAGRAPWFAAGATFAALTVGWSIVTAYVHAPAHRPNQFDGTFYRMTIGQIPLVVEGQLANSRTIVLGDSRAWGAVDRPIFDASPFGPVAVVWRPGADIVEVLETTLPALGENVVVVLTPASIGYPPNPVITEVMRKYVPAVDAEHASRREVLRWLDEERAHLLELGVPEAVIASLLDSYDRYHRRLRALYLGGPRAIDQMLGRAFQMKRFALVRTLRATQFKGGWFDRVNPDQSNDHYRKTLAPETYGPLFESLRGRLIVALRRIDEVSNVIVVRPPIHPNLRAVEDEAVPPSLIADLVAEAGLAYFDYGTSTYSDDGSHLDIRGAGEWTRALLEDLARVVGEARVVPD